DARFAATIARDIRHGLSVARAIEAPKVAAGDFVPLASPGAGLVYLSDQGRVRAMDARAEEIFRQFGAFDGHGVEVFRLDARSSAFEVIGRQLRELLFSRGYPDARTGMPYEVIHSNRSGCAIKLHGVALTNVHGAGGLAVIVELGESRALLRRRVQFRYGLSPRQAEILELITRTIRAGDCARLLRIAPGTLRSHLRDLMDRLDLPGIHALRGFAQEHLAGPASNSGGF
ncbi:MAG: helix-turn-helix transcriptional regulator, partial [Candidatus Binataceae bacterium]